MSLVIVLLAASLIATAIIEPKIAAAGWLIGLIFWAQILVGSLTLVMIHRLTGGRWGETIAPVVEPATAAVPVLVLLAIPLFVAIPVLYPWFAHPPALEPDVLSFYLNRPAFVLRSAVALGGWSALSLLLPRMTGPRGQLLAAFGLVFHALVISGVSIDWVLSLEAPFTSSSFGASVAISCLVAALAWAALRAPMATDDPGVGDLGGLLLATVLGLTYIDFMAVLVIWYGDLPREETWFVTREPFPWATLAATAFALVSVIPILTLIQSRFRNERTRLRSIGAVTLVGLAVYDAYLIAPPAGSAALAAALLAVVAIGLVVVLVMSSAARPSPSSQEAANAR
ncbi:MAG: hypothetical protein WCB02_05445 [Bradyrhizobium sp.]